jgi:hypothetical protein
MSNVSGVVLFSEKLGRLRSVPFGTNGVDSCFLDSEIVVYCP